MQGGEGLNRKAGVGNKPGVPLLGNALGGIASISRRAAVLDSHTQSQKGLTLQDRHAGLLESAGLSEGVVAETRLV